MHLKVMKIFIDGVLRFGIPPNFFLGIIRPEKNQDAKIMKNLLNRKLRGSSYGSALDVKSAVEDLFLTTKYEGVEAFIYILARVYGSPEAAMAHLANSKGAVPQDGMTSAQMVGLSMHELEM